MKKKMVIGIIVAVVLCGGYFIGSGFLRNGSVYMDGYSVSGDGREITLDIGVAASRGYIRKMEISQQMGGKLYIDCYAAFGGINGRIGAKSSFTLPLDEDTTMIGKTLIRKFCIRTRTVSGGGRRQTDKNNL